MEFLDSTRRDFITLLGGAAAWPIAAWAQQSERMRLIGVLMNLAADDREGRARLTAFQDGLLQLGWIEGHNVRLDIRWGAGDAERFRAYSTELVALAPDLILAASGAAVPPLLRATRSVPIVFVQAADPLGNGYVARLARPGGNATGFTNIEYGMGANRRAAVPPIHSMSAYECPKCVYVTRAGIYRAHRRHAHGGNAWPAGISLFG
jgi:ABC-type uncharacterized transport system substrate-binding protein